MNIQPIAEGGGEVGALPVLLRRLIAVADAYPVGVNQPIRRPRTELVRDDGIRKNVRIARLRPGCAAILIVFDGDDDCPRDLALRVQAWAQAEATPLPCYVVMPNREYEAWFLATIGSLRGPGESGMMRCRIPIPNPAAARRKSYVGGWRRTAAIPRRPTSPH